VTQRSAAVAFSMV